MPEITNTGGNPAAKWEDHPDHNRQKKIAAVNDMSGFGRCSLAVSIPVISTMGIQCCPLPTSIFSNHTGFPSFYYEDFTDHMRPYAREWKKLGLHFDGIMSGFLGSREQIDIVKEFIRTFKEEHTVVMVDPVCGDYGALYPTYTIELAEGMKELVRLADIITPNLTEACLLTGADYHEGVWKRKELIALAEKLHDFGPDKIVITGITQGEFIANFTWETGETPRIARSFRVGESRSGTGDIFASIIAADAVNGVPFAASVRKATRFIKKCVIRSSERRIPLTDGVCFEDLLHDLK